MKLTKKLLPALGMLALSACMLVTSTFAWFSMNDVVTAKDMTIAAKGDQVYLQIINSTDSFTNGAAQTTALATAKSATGNNALQPTNVMATTSSAYTGGKDFIWVYASGKDAVDGTVNDTGYTEVPSGSESLYYLANTFKIRLDATAGKEVASGALTVSGVNFAKVSVTNDEGETTEQAYTPDALGTSVCVLVVCGNNSQLWYQAGTDGTFTKKAGDAHLDANQSGVFANTSGVDVNVYVFFNGDDADCTLAKLADAKKNNYNSYSVEVSFTVASSN